MIKVIKYKLDNKNVEKTAKEIAGKIGTYFQNRLSTLEKIKLKKNLEDRKMVVHILFKLKDDCRDPFSTSRVPVAAFLNRYQLHRWREKQEDKARRQHKRLPLYRIIDVELVDM